MGVSHQRGGLNWGTGGVSLALFFLAVLLVAMFAGEPANVQNAGTPAAGK